MDLGSMWISLENNMYGSVIIMDLGARSFGIRSRDPRLRSGIISAEMSLVALQLNIPIIL